MSQPSRILRFTFHIKSGHCWKSKLTKQYSHVSFIPRIAGQLTLEAGETLVINTSEPSAAVVDNRGNRTDLLLLVESNHSFINQLSDSREWKYGVARLVFVKDIILNSNSNVNISGENALSVESLEGNIVVKTMIDLSCAGTELGGKCVGGYMPINKPKAWLSIIPGKPVQSFRFIPINQKALYRSGLSGNELPPCLPYPTAAPLCEPSRKANLQA